MLGHRAILREILNAFPTANPPESEDIPAGFVGQAESRELVLGLAGRSWTQVDSGYISNHGDWLVYLSPRAFAYFLPAWMALSLNYARAGYVADWTVSFFCHPPASEPMSNVQSRMIGALDSAQKSAVIRWITHMVQANPGSDVGKLRHQGLNVEDAVYNLSLRGYDASDQGQFAGD